MELGVYTATEKRPDFKLICKRFLPKCVCLRGSAPDPAGGLTEPQTPSWKRLGYIPIRPMVSTVPHSEGQSRIFIRCPAVPRNQQMSRIFRKWYYYLFRCRLDPILHVCLATQQSDELRIKIGKDRFRIRTPTGCKVPHN